jgi:hypothetical protein
MPSSSPVLAAARRLPSLVALALLAACAQAPRQQFVATPVPDKVTASLLSRMNAQQEAAVLEGIKPVIPALVRRVWGVPQAGVPWRLEVMMTPWRLTPEGRMDYWVDTSATATARDRARYAFRRAMEDSLSPPAPSRAWYVGTMRGVSVQQSRTSGDSLIVVVDVSAGMRCGDGRDVMHAMAYDVAFLRDAKGSLRLADRPPQWVAESAGQRTTLPDASCTPTPLLGAR